MFFDKQTTVFFNLHSKRERNAVYNKLSSLIPRQLPSVRSPSEILKHSGLTEDWQRRKM